MTHKWQLPTDPMIATRPYQEELARLTDPRQRQMLSTLIDHIHAVIAGDLEGVMNTMVAEPAFVTWGPTGDTGSKGGAATRAKYSGIRSGGAGVLNQTVEIQRFVYDASTIVLEMTETRLVPWQLARARGYAIDDESGQYAVHRHCAVIIPFDEAGLICGEHNYGYGWAPSSSDFERVPDEDVAPDYLAWLAEQARTS